MTNEKTKIPPLPKVPKPRNAPTASTNDKYYIKTQASSLLSKYSGKNKLEIFITKSDKETLERIELLFQNKFDLNHVICCAYRYLENNHPRVDDFKRNDEDSLKATVKIKPSQETLEAIFSYGKDDAASYLAGLGVYILSRELSLDLMFNSDEY